LRRLPRISFQSAALSGEKDAHPITLLLQVTGSHETIASIIARAGDDHDPTSRRVAPRNIGSDSPSSIFHKFHAGMAVRHRQPIRCRHLGGTEQLEHEPQKLRLP
jgi:hypothetical protein